MEDVKERRQRVRRDWHLIESMEPECQANSYFAMVDEFGRVGHSPCL